jgi:phage/conjugal plasmid C-4 type zinc finger TraR family protein
MTISTQPEYNNEEEAEVAQILSITRSMAAVAAVQEQLAKQRLQPSLEECEDCGEEIPQQRREIALGCTRCIHCQGLYERRKAGY